MAFDPLNLDEIDDPQFWLGLQPALHVEHDHEVPEFAVPDRDWMLAHMRAEGYVRVPDVVPERSVAAMRACVEALYERGIPLPFAFVYDELWDLFRGVRPFILVAPLVTDDADEKKGNHRSQYDAGDQDGSVNRCFVGIHIRAKANRKFTSKLIYAKIR